MTDTSSAGTGRGGLWGHGHQAGQVTAETAFPQPETWLSHRVSYGETDAMGYVYYAEYLHYFERARSQYIRELGMSYAEAERRGVFLPVREAGCRYRVPSRYDDLIWIRAGISKWGRASLDFVYEVLDEGRGRLLATGFTRHASVDATGRPAPLPGWFLEAFKPGRVGP